MADYACGDCNLSVDEGGLCERFEYNRAFGHLTAHTPKDQAEVDEDFKTASELEIELKALIEKYKNKFNKKYNYAEVMIQLSSVHTNLEEMTSSELLAEWRKISSNHMMGMDGF